MMIFHSPESDLAPKTIVCFEAFELFFTVAEKDQAAVIVKVYLTSFRLASNAYLELHLPRGKLFIPLLCAAG